MVRHTDARKIGVMHRHVIRIAEGFDEALNALIRDASCERVEDVNTFLEQGTENGLRITIVAEKLLPEEVAAERKKLKDCGDA